MSRSGYAEDLEDNWQLIRWRGAVASAVRGRRGQAFLREMLAALDQLEQKNLIARDLKTAEGVCALGAVGEVRGQEMQHIDPTDYETVAKAFSIPCALAQEIMFMNDEGGDFKETPEARFQRIRQWVTSNIKS